jgi:hypothetical protein
MDVAIGRIAGWEALVGDCVDLDHQGFQDIHGVKHARLIDF